MHGSRGEIISKKKIELLEMYSLQMGGKMTLDNKQVFELTTSASEDLSEVSDLEWLEK